MKQFSLKMYDFYFHKIKGLYNACVVNVIKGMLLFIIFLVTVHFLTNIKLKKGWGGKKKKKKNHFLSMHVFQQCMDTGCHINIDPRMRQTLAVCTRHKYFLLSNRCRVLSLTSFSCVYGKVIWNAILGVCSSVCVDLGNGCVICGFFGIWKSIFSS